jgi:flagellar biogenesis protein FliO
MRPELKLREKRKVAGGLALWLLNRIHRRSDTQPRLALLERITLAPRQSLVLVEAEGRRLLVATSAEGAPAFYPLDGPCGWMATKGVSHRSDRVNRGRRISW